MRRWFPVLVLLLVGLVGAWWWGSLRTPLPPGIDRRTQAGKTAAAAPQASQTGPAASASAAAATALEPKSETAVAVSLWREPLTGMELVQLPGGCYWMGSAPENPEGKRDEQPRHRVCVEPFSMGRFEVTRAQFRIFVDRTGYQTDAERQGYGWLYTGRWERKPGFNWRSPGFDQDDDHPVVQVSWNDATAMAAWLAAESGRPFILPSEAQWEYACRAGTDTIRFWGDRQDVACDYANVADTAAGREFPAWVVHPCDDQAVFTAAVGRYRPNPWGLHDMLGNVWEWCADVYLPQAYTLHSAGDPLIGRGGSERVVRGGSWYSRPDSVRCAERDRLREPDRRSHDQGFRLAVGQ